MTAADTILIVEDNVDDAYFMVRALEESGLEVEVCHDPVDALELLFDPARRLPRVVFLDLNLPRLSGHEVLRELRNNPRTRLLPVVVVSGSRTSDDVSSSYSLGANSHVQKPLLATEMAEKVGRVATYWAQLNSTPTADLPPESAGA